MSAPNRTFGSRDAFVRTNCIPDIRDQRQRDGHVESLMLCAFRDRTGVVRVYANSVNNQHPFISWTRRTQ